METTWIPVVLVLALTDIVISEGVISQDESEDKRVQRDAPMSTYNRFDPVAKLGLPEERRIQRDPAISSYKAFEPLAKYGLPEDRRQQRDPSILSNKLSEPLVNQGPGSFADSPSPPYADVRKQQNSPYYPRHNHDPWYPYDRQAPYKQPLSDTYSPYGFHLLYVPYIPTLFPFVSPEPPMTQTDHHHSTFHSYKELEPHCEWRMVFIAMEGNGRSVYSDFVTAGFLNAHVHGVKTLFSMVSYRDGTTLDGWDHLVISQVKLELYKDGLRKAWFIFDGLGSTIESWMSKERLIASPYKDLKGGEFNFFSVPGDAGSERRFFISREYNTCANDCGYLAVFDPQEAALCPYEEGALPRFAYALSPAGCGRFSDAEEVGFADRMVISLKVCDDLCKE